MNPWEAADYLGAAADSSQKTIEAAAEPHPDSPKDSIAFARDIEALDALARYYRDRIRSVTHLEFYQAHLPALGIDGGL